MNESAEAISGVVERITFHNEDSGYAVLRVRVPKNRDIITIVGTLTSVIAGEYIEARGEWVNDKTHGLQFKATELRTTPPHTAEGIARYMEYRWQREEIGRPESEPAPRQAAAQ